MKLDEEDAVKKISIRVQMGGKKKPIQKEAIVNVKSGKVICFVPKSKN